MITQKQATLGINIFSIVVGLVIAGLGYFCYEELINFICIFIGVVMTLVNIVYAYLYYHLAQEDKRFYANFTTALIFMILGILFIFNHGMAVSIVFGVFLVVLPIVRICLVSDHLGQFKKEIPFFIIGALMFFNVADVVFRWAIVVFGILLVILGIVNLILSFTTKKIQDDNSNVIDAEIKEL